MFDTKSFFSIWNYLLGKQNNTETELKVLASGEKTKSQNLFDGTIDQPAFMTDDYNRLKNFLVDWYSTHRTIIRNQQSVSDIYSLTESQIVELLSSFGYNFSTEDLSHLTKANLLLDLVNLYREKGTPSSIAGILGYYGINNIDLSEYWLEKDSNSNLVFRSNVLYQNNLGHVIAWNNIPFNDMVKNDPHWLLSEEKLLKSVSEGKIRLPIKSPYFGIRPYTNLTNFSIVMGFMNRVIQDEYDKYIAGNVLSKDITVNILNIKASVLGFFVCCCYAFNKEFTRNSNTQENVMFYNKSDNSRLTDALDLFDQYNVIPTSRSEQKNKIIEIDSIFSKELQDTFISSVNIESMLYKMNPDLKLAVDNWFGMGKGDDIVSYLLKDLDDWFSSNYRNLISINTTILGIGYLSDFLKIINFFKPYRSRMTSFEFALAFQDKLKDSVIIEDLVSTKQQVVCIDFDTANSIPCCDSTACNIYSRDTYDCGSYYDIGASHDKDDLRYEFQSLRHDILNHHTSDSTNYTFIEYTSDSTSDINFVVHAGGFSSFDTGGIFDAYHGNDVCEIFVSDS